VKRGDRYTLDLFAVPEPPRRAEGALNCSLELRHLLSRALKEARGSRYEVAARMSELLGVEVTKYQLDAWTAESREGWRFPLEYLVAFEVACETHVVSEWVAERRGCRLLKGRESLLADLGRIEQMVAELREERRRIKEQLRPGHGQRSEA